MAAPPFRLRIRTWLPWPPFRLRISKRGGCLSGSALTEAKAQISEGGRAHLAHEKRNDLHGEAAFCPV